VQVISGRTPVLHAVLAPVVFSLIVVVAVLTSKGWQAGPRPVESPWAPLRPLGIAVPVLVLLQIGLGAAFRHNAMGVLWHILNAMIVLIVILIAGVFALRQYPEHPSLRPAALTLVIVAGVQVLLGFTVYMVLLISSENNTGLIITGVVHVVNGALTLAASVVFAMQMQRNLIKSSGV
jgi:heme A synthase